MYKEYLEIFKIINNNKIDYFILRDYNSVKNIVESKDIDIYVNRRNKKQLHKLLINNQWFCSSINDTKYPHKQYYKLINGIMFKLDFVFDFYYGKKNYKFDYNMLFSNSKHKKKFDLFIPREDEAVVTMILHIIFDKEELSEKNKLILSNMLTDYNDSKFKISKDYSVFINLAEQIVSNNCDNFISEQQQLLKTGLLKRNVFYSILYNFKQKINHFLLIILKILSNRSIAFIGIDGSGKSSIINKFAKVYVNNCYITYMGFKNYNIKKLDSMMNNNTSNIFYKIYRRLVIFIEMIYRYYKRRFSSRIILFDRYVDDIFINASKRHSLIASIFYKLLYPKPKFKIYLYCDSKTSFERKNDIIDKEKFIFSKNKYDTYYLNKKSNRILCINTTNKTEIDTLKEICDFINFNNKNFYF